MHLGRFSSEGRAARAHDVAALRLHGPGYECATSAEPHLMSPGEIVNRDMPCWLNLRMQAAAHPTFTRQASLPGRSSCSPDPSTSSSCSAINLPAAEYEAAGLAEVAAAPAEAVIEALRLEAAAAAERPTKCA